MVPLISDAVSSISNITLLGTLIYLPSVDVWAEISNLVFEYGAPVLLTISTLTTSETPSNLFNVV